MKKISENQLEYNAYEAKYYYKNEPFTGVAYEYHSDDTVASEAHYVNGYVDGTLKGWYPSGHIRYEYNLKQGAAHGLARDWYENGQLSREALGELGITVHEKKWNEKGELEMEFELKESDPLYKTLLSRREIWKKH